MNKKDLVIVALATFCLTSTLFMILPSRSTERDPWADVSGPTAGKPDGTVNMRDIAYEVAHFNQDVSNITRDVNVKDSIFTWSSGHQYIAPPGGGAQYNSWRSDQLSTVGFKQVTVQVIPNCSVSVLVVQGLGIGGGALQLDGKDGGLVGWFTETYDVKGTYIEIYVENWGNSTVDMWCYVYMTSTPSPQSQPSYDEQCLLVNQSTYGVYTRGIVCNGYSRLSISVNPSVVASNGTFDVTLCLAAIYWTSQAVPPGTSEHLPASALNITFYVDNGICNTDWTRPPFITETKMSQCYFEWVVAESHNLPPDWWVSFYVSAYLRNE